MNLRRRVVIILFLSLIGLIGLFCAVLAVVVIQKTSALEGEAMQYHLRYLASVMRGELDTLKATTRDWAYWDDTYNFAETRDESYIVNNLKPMDISTINVGLVEILDNEGEVLLRRAVDLNKSEEIPIPQGFEQYIDGQSPLIAPQDLVQGSSGIIMIPECLLLVSAYPILDSNLQKPKAGTLIFGTCYDDKKIAEMGHDLNLSVNLLRYENTSQIPGDFTALSTAIPSERPVFRVLPVNEEIIRGELLLRDIYNQPVGVLRVDEKRAIYQHGVEILRWIFLAFIAMGVLFGFVTVIMIDRIMIRHLRSLNLELTRISEQVIFPAKVSVTGGGEIAGLSRRFNQILTRMHEKWNALEETRDELAETNLWLTKAYRELSQVYKVKMKVLAKMSEEFLASTNFSSEKEFRKMVEKVLLYSRIEAGDYVLEKDWFSVQCICETCVKEIEDTAREKGIGVTCNIGAQDERIWVDKKCLSKAIIILLENRLGFLYEGGQIVLNAYLDTNTGHIRFVIWDRAFDTSGKEATGEIVESISGVKGNASERDEAVAAEFVLAARLVELQRGNLFIEGQVDGSWKLTILLSGSNDEDLRLPLNPFQSRPGGGPL